MTVDETVNVSYVAVIEDEVVRVAVSDRVTLVVEVWVADGELVWLVERVQLEVSVTRLESVSVGTTVELLVPVSVKLRVGNEIVSVSPVTDVVPLIVYESECVGTVGEVVKEEVTETVLDAVIVGD